MIRWLRPQDDAKERPTDELIDKSTGTVGEYLEVGLDALSAPSSKRLRQNLIEAGAEVPDYPHATHHIVAGNSPKAAEARAILQRLTNTFPISP